MIIIPQGGSWGNLTGVGPYSFVCGYEICGRLVSSERGWTYAFHGHNLAAVAICPNCRCPTVIDLENGRQIPAPLLGGEVRNLPEGVRDLWVEVRSCTGAGAYTAAVLAGRTLLMHIAVSQGADSGRSFLNYVDYLVEHHYAPPNSKIWVDKIRAHGNEATHEIVLKNEGDAKEIMVFLEMLLKFIYEFPNLG